MNMYYFIMSEISPLKRIPNKADLTVSDKRSISSNWTSSVYYRVLLHVVKSQFEYKLFTKTNTFTCTFILVPRTKSNICMR